MRAPLASMMLLVACATQSTPAEPPPAPPAPPPPVVARAPAPLRIDAVVPFPSDVATPGPQVATTLEDVARALRDHPAARVEIAGHCDDQETVTVAYARANLVASALAARGVPRARVNIETYGTQRPLAPNTTPEGRAKNRRVDFQVLESSGEADPGSARPNSGSESKATP